MTHTEKNMLIFIIVMSALMCILLAPAVYQINKHGLKSIVEGVWEGPNPTGAAETK